MRGLDYPNQFDLAHEISFSRMRSGAVGRISAGVIRRREFITQPGAANYASLNLRYGLKTSQADGDSKNLRAIIDALAKAHSIPANYPPR